MPVASLFAAQMTASFANLHEVPSTAHKQQNVMRKLKNTFVLNKKNQNFSKHLAGRNPKSLNLIA